MPPAHLKLSSVETFKALDAATRAELEQRLVPMPVPRGTALVTEGEMSDALFVVVSGRFMVEVGDPPERVTEIAPGATIGEIAFFTGTPRTATVRAIRDSVVVALSRSDFEELSQRAPAIWHAVSATLATRLAAETRRGFELKRDVHARRAGPPPRTIAVIRAGHRPIPEAFATALRTLAARHPGTQVFDAASARDGLDTEQLNELESQLQRIVLFADDELTTWSERAIRQADEVLLVGSPLADPVGAAVPLNAIEEFALRLMPRSQLRLALVHAKGGVVQGTRHWLANRPAESHHHVALADPASLNRLWRFICGEARGYVACGGGAFTAAHVGIYKAFLETGGEFDLYGGTSGGAAMAAAFAQRSSADEIAEGIRRMFIDGKALQHYTLPRYGLLDHTHFDRHLQATYGNTLIEDLWLPFYAVSADLAQCEIVVHRTGPVWEAVRASSAIPGLLPPYYASDGRTLVDGSVISNVPVETMHALKRGPNVVVTFNTADRRLGAVDYASLPGRRDLVWRMLNRARRRELPEAPSATTILVLSLMANRSHYERHIEPQDWLLTPPTPDDMGALDWRRHATVIEAAYRFAMGEIAAREQNRP